MSQFAKGLEGDLYTLNRNMADQIHNTELYFDGMSSHIEILKRQFQHTFELATDKTIVSVL